MVMVTVAMMKPWETFVEESCRSLDTLESWQKIILENVTPVAPLPSKSTHARTYTHIDHSVSHKKKTCSRDIHGCGLQKYTVSLTISCQSGGGSFNSTNWHNQPRTVINTTPLKSIPPIVCYAQMDIVITERSDVYIVTFYAFFYWTVCSETLLSKIAID